LIRDEALRDEIHRANISVHREEARYYEALHPEVYSKQEQKRIAAELKSVDELVSNNKKRALDVGAGTGNLTSKFLQMGYTVTAIDISPEMYQILKRKYSAYLESNKLTVVNSPIENLRFEAEFDVIACYSVLHHLPDYTTALRNLCHFLKKGGVIYIDHEASPFYWKNEPSMLSSFVKDIYFHSSPILNSFYFQLVGLKVPSINYALSDYWHKKEHPLDHSSVQQIFKQEKFEFLKRTDYYQNSTWIANPLSLIYRLICRPEMSFWIAKK
jgi:ubiquinone/menaquinone biosynthesis C-methylase UbiE